MAFLIILGAVQWINIVIINSWMASPQLSNMTAGWQRIEVMYGYNIILNINIPLQKKHRSAFLPCLHLLGYTLWTDSDISLTWSHQCIQMQLHQRVSTVSPRHWQHSAYGSSDDAIKRSLFDSSGELLIECFRIFTTLYTLKYRNINFWNSGGFFFAKAKVYNVSLK